MKAAIAGALKLPARKVEYPYRVALQNGEISKGKRGRGGASLTPPDAATAVIAFGASCISNEVLAGLREFKKAPCTTNLVHEDAKESTHATWQFKGFRIPRLQLLPPGHSFFESLTAVIESARDRAFEKSADHVEIVVSFTAPGVGAAIGIELRQPARTCLEQVYYLTKGYLRDDEEPPLQILATVDEQLIYTLANLFRYEGVDDDGIPLDPKHPWNSEGSLKEIEERRAKVERYIDARGFI